MAEHNQEYDMALKYGRFLPKLGFQVVETRKKRVNHGMHIVIYTKKIKRDNLSKI